MRNVYGRNIIVSSFYERGYKKSKDTAPKLVEKASEVAKKYQFLNDEPPRLRKNLISLVRREGREHNIRVDFKGKVSIDYCLIDSHLIKEDDTYDLYRDQTGLHQYLLKLPEYDVKYKKIDFGSKPSLKQNDKTKGGQAFEDAIQTVHAYLYECLELGNLDDAKFRENIKSSKGKKKEYLELYVKTGDLDSFKRTGGDKKKIQEIIDKKTIVELVKKTKLVSSYFNVGDRIENPELLGIMQILFVKAKIPIKITKNTKGKYLKYFCEFKPASFGLRESRTRGVEITKVLI